MTRYICICIRTFKTGITNYRKMLKNLSRRQTLKASRSASVYIASSLTQPIVGFQVQLVVGGRKTISQLQARSLWQLSGVVLQVLMLYGIQRVTLLLTVRIETTTDTISGTFDQRFDWEQKRNPAKSAAGIWKWQENVVSYLVAQGYPMS